MRMVDGLIPPRGERLRFVRMTWPAFAFVGMMGAMVLVAPVITRFFDPSDLFVDQGLSGPYLWARTDAEGTTLGPRLPVITAGASFGVVSVFCPERQASYTALIEIQREEDGEIMHSRRRDYAPGARGCGPLATTFGTAADWPPRAYRIIRRATIHAPGRRSLTRELGGLTIILTAPRGRTPVERPVLFPGSSA